MNEREGKRKMETDGINMRSMKKQQIYGDSYELRCKTWSRKKKINFKRKRIQEMGWEIFMRK